MKKYRKIILTFIAAFFLLSPTSFVHAGAIDLVKDFSLSVITKTTATIIYIFGYLGGIAVFLGGTLTNWALNLNNNILHSQVVEIGWTITRDLANLGFVLAIILIALATILQIKEYEMKKTLAKLIAAALLVNFSLVFAGIFINFSGMLTNFFLDQVTGQGPGAIGERLAGSLKMQSLFSVTENEGVINNTMSGLANSLNGMASFIASLFFITLLTGISAISLLGLALMFFIRYIHLNFLLVFMPLAWLAMIFPTTGGHWKNWWSQFFKWIWFAPTAAFFIYLAIAIAEKSGAVVGVENLINPGDTLGLAIQNIGGTIGQMATVIGILFAGLMSANAMGGIGSDFSLKLAKGFGNKVKQAGMWGPRLVGREARERAALGAEKTQGVIEKMQLAGMPGGISAGILNAPIRGIGTYLKTATRFPNKAIEQYKKEYGSYSLKDLQTMIHGVFGGERKTAIMEILNEKKALKGDHQPYAPLLRRYGRKPIKNPAWDPEILRLAEDGNIDELQKVMGEKLSELDAEDIKKKIQWGDNYNNKLKGPAKDRAWKLIIDTMSKQIINGKIEGENIGGLFSGAGGSKNKKIIHSALRAAIPGDNEQTKDNWLKTNNSDLYYFFKGNLAQRLLKTLQPSEETEEAEEETKEGLITENIEESFKEARQKRSNK